MSGGRPSEAADGWLRENLEHSLPFLLVGGCCVALAVWLHGTGLHVFGSRLPIWPLFAGLGVTFAGGGAALSVVEEAGPAPSAPDPARFVVVPRADWEQLVAQLPTIEGAEAPLEEPIPAAPLALARSLAASSGAAISVDPAEVQEASEELLRENPPPTEEPTGTPRSGTPDELHALPPTPAPEPKASFPPTDERPTLVPPGSGGLPARPDESLAELESILTGMGPAAAPAGPSAPSVPSRSTDRCVTCGTLVTAYSEQICVRCDRPLCDACLDLTALEGHPAMCSSCHASVPGPAV